MASTLGEKLRQAREARGISITEVAEQTRISRLYLESIENDDYRPLPGGIFNKGFVKSYARHVGIDEAEALSDYSQLIAEQEGVQGDEPKTYRPEVLTDDRRSSSTLLTVIFAVVILGLMTWGILALVKYASENSFQTTNTNTSNTNNSANTNANSNVNASPPIPSTNEIKFEFKVVSEKINVTYWTDADKLVSKDVLAGETLSLNAKEKLKISYYRGFTPDKVQLTLNGKQITPPNPPAKGNNTVFEINKTNIEQILQGGKMTADENNPANTNVRTR